MTELATSIADVVTETATKSFPGSMIVVTRTSGEATVIANVTAYTSAHPTSTSAHPTSTWGGEQQLDFGEKAGARNSAGLTSLMIAAGLAAVLVFLFWISVKCSAEKVAKLNWWIFICWMAWVAFRFRFRFRSRDWNEMDD